MQIPEERAGAFYLGADFDLASGQRTETPVEYDARDLTTHAVCIGMTGSGKTGLCVGLLEEAALDGVPAILIDPKGDITNLLLQFPELRPADFEPWVNLDDAARKGLSVADFAGRTAEQWKTGLADWGIDSARIRRTLDSVDYRIFTPGSEAGLPINILGSLAAPGLDFDSEAEILRERIGGTVAALLGLVGIDADPVRSREAVLLANIFEHAWRKDEDLDLAKLIMAIQNPPMRQLGVFDVDTFYPAKERFALAMTFNNLVAAPGFQSWLQGEPLDAGGLLYGPDGRPRHSVIYLAHLSDSERMFIVTLLLENLVTWVRRQSGTTSLRALLYFDEVFGYLPPSAEPPSKRPLLTLLKQARAFGLGLVLVTQNPVDLDYKGLTNAGTWFIGRLQAERDKLRVLDGLQGAIAAAGGQAEPDFDRLISALSSRVFLLHNVHAGAPRVFHTRWAQSYLRGPLTRPQVRALLEARGLVAAPAAAPAGVRAAATPGAPAAGADSPSPSPAPAPHPAPPPVAAAAAPPEGYLIVPPAIDPALPAVYLPVELERQVAIDAAGAPAAGARTALVYLPALAALATVRFFDAKRGVDHRIELRRLAQAPEGAAGADWAAAERLAAGAERWRREPEAGQGEGPFFRPVPESINQVSELKRLRGELADRLYAEERLRLDANEALGLVRRPGESDADWSARLEAAAREGFEAEKAKREAAHAKELARLDERLRREQAELNRDEAEHSARKQQELVGLGESVMGMLFRRRRLGSRVLSGASSKRRMTSKAAAEVEESREAITALQTERDALEAGLQAELAALEEAWRARAREPGELALAPRRSDVEIQHLSLAWAPHWLLRYHEGQFERSLKVPAYGVERA